MISHRQFLMQTCVHGGGEGEMMELKVHVITIWLGLVIFALTIFHMFT